MKLAFKIFTMFFSLIVLTFLGIALYFQATIPDKLYLSKGDQLSVHSFIDVQSVACNGSIPDGKLSSYKADLKLLGTIQIKSVNVSVVERKQVIPAGTAFGIKMFTQGVMVVGQSDIRTDDGLKNPSKEAGIVTGDIVISINGTKVASNEDVGEVVAKCGGANLQFEISRDGETSYIDVTPVKDKDGVYRVGIWVRDSSAGIGTMTYYDPESKIYTGLGHAICDVDTGEIMPLSKGEIVPVAITGIIKGKNGSPGELKGMFKSSKSIGDILVNDERGIFGNYYDSYISTHEPVPLAYSYEVEEGKATIYATLDSGQPEEYEIEIEKIMTTNQTETKNMIIRVTDPELLTKTGGIVQGMSGCPILQNGKLVGAVTHVFVNNSTKGYAIFAENMSLLSENMTENLMAS